MFDPITHKESGQTVCKPLLRESSTFNDVFPEATFNKDSAPDPVEIPGIGLCGPYCSTSPGHNSIWVRCADWVTRGLADSLVVPTLSPLSFQVIKRGDWSLITVRYSEILAERYVALVPTHTVPTN